MPRFEVADKEILKTVQKVKVMYHKRLVDAGVKIKVLLAFGKVRESGERDPALKHGGYPAAALIKKTNHRDRVAGLDDAILVIDGDQLPDWPHDTVEALIDHELMHLETVIQNGTVKLDDCGRPVLTIRLHDSQIGVFHEIIARHGQCAIDTQVVAKLCEDTRQWVQPLLNWG
jgi:Putative phage metallopeptidase